MAGHPNHQLRIQYIFNLQDPQAKYWDLQQKPLDSRPFPPSFQGVNTWQEIAPEMVRSLTFFRTGTVYIISVPGNSANSDRRFGISGWPQVTFFESPGSCFQFKPKENISSWQWYHELITLHPNDFESTFNRKSFHGFFNMKSFSRSSFISKIP